MKKKLIMMLAAIVGLTGFAEDVTNVRGIQQENSHLVDIYYDIEAPEGGLYSVAVQLEGRTNEVSAATFTGDVGEGVAPGRNRHIVWNAGADWPNKKGDVRAVVTATKVDVEDTQDTGFKTVQLWEGGPFWADRNIGADKPEDFGLYFWWGDTIGHSPTSYTSLGWTFSFGFSRYNSEVYTWGEKIGDLQSAGWLTKDRVLTPEHDAAHVLWGGWRMPTYQELSDLSSKCDWTYAAENGVKGYIVRGKGGYASKSIFLPAAGYGEGTSLKYDNMEGYYWSSVPYVAGSYLSSTFSYAYGLVFNSSSHGTSYQLDRDFGRSIRPVKGSDE